MPTRSSNDTRQKFGRAFAAPLLSMNSANVSLTSVPSTSVPAGTGPTVRRRIPPASGYALETLGHAIEYLADEYAFSTAQMGVLDSEDPRVEAIQLLMSLNRQVYYACPEVEPLRRRLLNWLFGTPAVNRPNQTSL